MKYLVSVLLCLTTLCGYAQNEEGIQFSHGSWSEILELAEKENKAIFIDCYTSWCGPCKMLSKDIFTQAKVGEVFNANFINFKVDMEKGEGPMLKERFNVAAFPTLVWVNSKGEELHKTVGAPKAEALIQVANEVIDGKGLAALQRNYEANTNDYAGMLTYVEALAKAYEKDKIQAVLATYFKQHKGKALLSNENYSLINNYLSDIYSPAFIWFDKHQDKFASLYVSEEVEKKLYQSYLSYGHSLVKKNKVDYKGFELYKKTLEKRKVVGREKILSYVQESVYRAENNWDAYIKKVNENIASQYHDANNSFLYYNWAKAIDNGQNANSSHYMQAAQWMEKAFEVSQWPVENNIVYLKEKAKILVKAKADKELIDVLHKRIESLKQSIN